jgi:hypothetical protein
MRAGYRAFVASVQPADDDDSLEPRLNVHSNEERSLLLSPEDESEPRTMNRKLPGDPQHGGTRTFDPRRELVDPAPSRRDCGPETGGGTP